MLTRRGMIAGLVGLAAAPMVGCANRSQPAVSTTSSPPVTVPAVATDPSGRLDAVIDISHWTTVSDFNQARRSSNILGVVHKASEGGDWRDPLYVERRSQAEAAGLMWGAYHFGTRQYSGAQQAAMFLSTAQPGPNTLMALDLEFNEANPGNTMKLSQAEEFVQTILAATGRLPLVYTSAAWADGKPMGRAKCNLGGAIGGQSILAQCQLWLADYRVEPRIPGAWTDKGWHFWQYAGDAVKGGPFGAQARSVSGVDKCDRNLFPGDAVALRRFWTEEAGRKLA
ncbi:glycoside hydrolase family 25 protein [Telmatospirillum siberiense]|uniref:1,4-beta-N-acetylmuramidase n=1 Tax=Telmatospirillum siberiense TaxID=382514 RepID=A0A2N3PUU8_9PROT|nr:glycoside hydrolase family 25 protein [Telmatospirillum siberiense]PKU24168.1 1,4-beta-N-acetylmuramidase [Telmatospirillum siberiense]